MAKFGFKLPRSPLHDMPEVAILAAVSAAKNDLNYAAAKSGDAVRAAALIGNFVGPEQIEMVRRLLVGGGRQFCRPFTLSRRPE